MPRPTDQWFRDHRIEDMIPIVDHALDRLDAARRLAQRCRDLVKSANPDQEINQRRAMTEACTMFQNFRDQALIAVTTLRNYARTMDHDILRSRARSAMRHLHDSISLDTLPQSSVFEQDFERQLVRLRQANRVRRSRRPDSPQLSPQIDVVPIPMPVDQPVHRPIRRPTPEQLEAVPKRAPQVKARLVESPVTIIERPMRPPARAELPSSPGIGIQEIQLVRRPPQVQTSATSNKSQNEGNKAANAPSKSDSAPSSQNAPQESDATDEDLTTNRFSLLDIDWD